MKSFGAYKPVPGTTHVIPKEHKLLKATPANEMIAVTLIVRRQKGSAKLRDTKTFSKAKAVCGPVDRNAFIATHGADPSETEKVIEYARSMGLDVVETNEGARSVVVRGTVAKINKAFGVKLNNYQGHFRKYHSHTGPAKLPSSLVTIVDAVIGLQDRPIHAKAFNTAHKKSAGDPPNTKPVTPLQIAQLYGFPSGNGEGQTIGIYEMAVEDPQTGQLADAGYTDEDVANTFKAFGGGLKVPKIIDVAVDGVKNSGINDGETLLDITVSGAIAQAATIAVYFTGAEPQNMIHSLQRMIHPGTGDPVPTIISISYGWGGDDQADFTQSVLTQFGELFQDAANLHITVLVSSGDSGCFLGAKHAQASYPATEPMVIACGGTTVGNVSGSKFDEYAWNDVGAAGPGASGGGVSALFPPPSYQSGAKVPKNIYTKKAGRGIPDVAGNASENSGYTQVAAGMGTQPVGGTSAVAPLYAGLIARINANLGASVGFINPVIYSLGATAFSDIVSPPGPANNSFNGVTGYPVTEGWDAVTGRGSVKGVALQNGLKAGN